MRGRDRRPAMSAVARWNENDLVESEVVAHGFGDEEMTVVNGVEPTAENTDIDDEVRL